MLKYESGFLGKLFKGGNIHKTRTNDYWTDLYPTPELSWAKRTVNKASDWIYQNIDNFFCGSVNQTVGDAVGDHFPSNKSNTNYFEWELKQNIVDIALIDIRSSLCWVLPGFIKKIALRLHQLTVLYLYTDVVYEEEIQEWIESKDIHIIQTEDCKNKFIYPFQVINDRILSKCLFLNDWLKKVFSRFRRFLKLEREKETYYLLGYFAPQPYHDSYDDQNYLNNGPDKVKLNPAYSFHKRN